MLGAIAALGCFCVVGGARPELVTSAVARVADQLGAGIPDTQASVAPVGNAAIALWILAATIAAVTLLAGRARRVDEGPTWGCGYAAPTPRMQYTGRGFAQLLGELLPSFLRARVDVTPPSGLFPAKANLESETADPLTRSVYEPAIAKTADRFARLRWVQRGIVHAYVLYILVAVVLGLAWAAFQGALG
jgi:hypothetical protein